MSSCEWYQLGCKWENRNKATMDAATDTIPERIEDVTRQQLLMVAGVGLGVLILVGFFTR